MAIMVLKNPRRETRPVCTFLCALALLMAATGMAQTPAAGQPASAGGAMADIQAVTAQRTGFQVIPSGDPQADQAISHAVSCLLAEKLTKDAAVQIALLNNRNLQATLAEIGISNADLVEAGLLKNPVLDLLYRKSNASGASANLEWSVTLDFINILTLPMRRCIAASEFETTKLRTANEVLDLAFDVQVAYYNLQAAMQTGQLYQDAVKASKEAYEAVRMIHEAGNISDLALHQEQVFYEQQKLNLAEAERDVVELREELNMLMGLWGPSTDWKLPSKLPAMPAREFQGRGLESVAVYQRLDLAAARQEIETVARELGLQNATRLLPELEGSIGAERETDGSWLRGGGVSLPLPIFNQGQTKAQRQRARLLQAQHRYYAVAVGIRSDVRKAFGQMRKSRDRVKYYDTIMLPLFKRIVEENHLMYNAMEAGPAELLRAKRDEYVGQREKVEALRDYWVARSELERTMGGSLECYTCPPTASAHASAAPAGSAKASGSKSTGAGQASRSQKNGSAASSKKSKNDTPPDADQGTGEDAGAAAGSGDGSAAGGAASGGSGS